MIVRALLWPTSQRQHHSPAYSCKRRTTSASSIGCPLRQVLRLRCAIRPQRGAMARGQRRVIRQLPRDIGVRFRSRLQDIRVVVVDVVAPQERSIDEAAVETRNVAFVVAEIAAEIIDFPLGPAAILPGQDAAVRYADPTERPRVGTVVARSSA